LATYNVNVFVNVRDVTAGVRAKQLNMFASAVWLRQLPPAPLSLEVPSFVLLSVRSIMLNGDGYLRVRRIVEWAVAEILELGVSGELLRREHVGSLGAATWIPFYLCERDSSRPAEMLEILKDISILIDLGVGHFTGTC